MATVTFTLELDDETIRDFDALAATKGQNRDGMMEQLIEEFVECEADAPGYDAWFRSQVEEALRESGKPDAVLYSHEEVMAEAKAVIEARVARAQKRAG